MDGRLVGLVEPTEQPKADRSRRTLLPCDSLRFDAKVCSAIVAHCVRHEWCSAAYLYEELDFLGQGMPGWSPISRLCGNGGRGLLLWDRFGFYVPCRDNAAKALVRVWGLYLDELVQSLGFANPEELVAAVNQLPLGSEVGDRRDRDMVLAESMIETEEEVARAPSVP